MGLADIVTLLTQSGLAVALVVFLTWQGWERERKADARELAAHDFANTRILSRLDDAIQRQREMAEVLALILNETTRTREDLDRFVRRYPASPSPE